MSEVAGGRAANNGGRAAAGPIAVPLPPQPPQPQTTTPPPRGSGVAGVRTPTEIMYQRREREARKQAEAEAAKQREEEKRRKSAEERLAAVGGQVGNSGRGAPGVSGVPGSVPRVQGGASGQVGPGATAPPPTLQPPLSQTPQDPAMAYRRGPAQSQGQPRPAPTQQPVPGPSRSAQPQPQPSQPQPQPQQRTTPAQPPPQQPPSHLSAQASGTTNTFPHAFERWETLSSHWEGLTSYWLHRLEANESELRAQPLAQQMSRQIADLSAAGANLFHAVVELQRLRASSERKFQRWFFDTRAEQERSRETIAELERNLKTEREARKHLERNSGEQYERDRRNSEKVVAETRRELKIAKDEARRAWEELGRREQEERERTMSLREGLPTIVGGVQVVPMMGGMGVSRAGSVSQAPSQTGQSATYAEQSDPFVEAGPGAGQAQQRGYPPTSTPATEGSTSTARGAPPSQPMSPPRQEYSYPSPSAAALAAAQQQPFYSHPDQHLNPASPQYAHAPPSSLPPHSNGQIAGPTSAPTSFARAEDESSIVSDEGAEYVRQFEPGHHQRHESAGTGSDEYDVQADIDRERALAARYGIHPPDAAASGQPQPLRGGGVQAQDYEYGGYDEDEDDEDQDEDGPYTGAGFSGWENMRTHHHPTRLSDVIEEDERSRTSPSRASQASRGLF